MNKYNKKKKRLSEISEFDFLMIKEALFFFYHFFSYHNYQIKVIQIIYILIYNINRIFTRFYSNFPLKEYFPFKESFQNPKV